MPTSARRVVRLLVLVLILVVNVSLAAVDVDEVIACRRLVNIDVPARRCRVALLCLCCGARRCR